MKYLNAYKIFESLISINDIISDLKDICIELGDDGYNIIVKWQNSKTNPHIMCVVNLQHSVPSYKSFPFSNIREEFDRMDRYVKSKGFTSASSCYSDHWMGFQPDPTYTTIADKLKKETFDATHNYLSYMVCFYPSPEDLKSIEIPE